MDYCWWLSSKTQTENRRKAPCADSFSWEIRIYSYYWPLFHLQCLLMRIYISYKWRQAMISRALNEVYLTRLMRLGGLFLYHCPASFVKRVFPLYSTGIIIYHCGYVLPSVNNRYNSWTGFHVPQIWDARVFSDSRTKWKYKVEFF